MKKIETAESITIHWYSANWNMSRKGYVFLNTKHIKNPLLKGNEVLRKILVISKNKL